MTILTTQAFVIQSILFKWKRNVSLFRFSTRFFLSRAKARRKKKTLQVNQIVASDKHQAISEERSGGRS